MVEITTEDNGRYIEIHIEGVANGAVAFDKKERELIVSEGPEDGRTIPLPTEEEFRTE